MDKVRTKTIASGIRKVYRKVSLKSKMKVMMFVMIIPLSIFVIYIISNMMEYTNYYEKVYHNISLANEISLEFVDFKEKLDYCMYQIVIGSSSFEEEKPYERLEAAHHKVDTLEQYRTHDENKITIRDIRNYLNVLHDTIKEIEDSFLKKGPKYDYNLMKVDYDIITTTSLIQERMRSYIYYETFQMQEILQDMRGETKRSVTVAVGVFAVLMLLTFFIIELISHSVTKPLKELCQAIVQVGEGDFTTRAPDAESDEIIMLSKSFNKMIVKIGELIERITTEQANLKKTELKLLQSQINPHFLYNTLDAIMWLATDGKNEEVVKMVNALSNFFRVSLSKGRDYITLREEALHIRSYLQIQQFRYSDILEFEIKIPKELEDYVILKLTLQPLVENALYHGVKNKRDGGKITVEAVYEKGGLLLKVMDDGMGMDEKRLAQVNATLAGNVEPKNQSGFGLVNVNERIQLNYGKEYGMTIESEYGKGTLISLCLPATYI